MEDENDGRVPEFELRDANQRADSYQKKYIDAQAKLDKHTVREAMNDALRDLDANQVDVDNIRTILEKSNLRADGDRGIIDYEIDGQSFTATPREIVQLLKTRDDHANLFNRPKPRELTAQEKHLAWLNSLDPKKYMAYRKRRGADYLSPE